MLESFLFKKHETQGVGLLSFKSCVWNPPLICLVFVCAYLVDAWGNSLVGSKTLEIPMLSTNWREKRKMTHKNGMAFSSTNTYQRINHWPFSSLRNLIQEGKLELSYIWVKAS